ncbi:ABATE domain-containing protein, partial [Nonomuraea sp. NPDC005983]|uniref:ABATE domain-containing protein n=1 Tax=Nonomuraea sp. NPDC005983 TaxID=3155595 RepID=UPI00339F0DCF
MRQYAETGLVAIDLANTWDEYLDDPERLPDVAALLRFCHELHEPPDTTAPDRPDTSTPRASTSGMAAPGMGGLDGGDLDAVRAVRERLRAVLLAEPGERTAALARWAADLPLRALVQDADGRPELRLVASDEARLSARL